MAAQTLIHHEPYRMSASQRYIEVAPEDVIWDNLVMNPYERRIRSALSWAATIALILLMAIPGRWSYLIQCDDRSNLYHQYRSLASLQASMLCAPLIIGWNGFAKLQL
jgi:hypothetical protein